MLGLVGLGGLISGFLTLKWQRRNAALEGKQDFKETRYKCITLLMHGMLDFERALGNLQKHGYPIVTIDDLAALLRTEHINAFLFGSDDFIRSLGQFIETPSEANLVKTALTMRRDLWGMETELSVQDIRHVEPAMKTIPASTMTDPERAQLYVTLSEMLYRQHHDRRALEWKIHLALWTLLVVAGWAIVSNDKELGAMSLIFFVAFPIHLVWCLKIHRGIVREQNLSIRYRKAADFIVSGGTAIDDLDEPSTFPTWIERRFKHYLWWLGTLLATTGLLIIIVVWLTW